MTLDGEADQCVGAGVRKTVCWSCSTRCMSTRGRAVSVRTLRCGPANSGTDFLISLPKAMIHLTTTPRSFSWYKSSVSKHSCSRTPNARAARRKYEIFSICLKAIFDVSIFGIVPGLITFTTLHSACPDLRDSAKVESEGKGSPRSSSTQDLTDASALQS